MPRIASRLSFHSVHSFVQSHLLNSAHRLHLEVSVAASENHHNRKYNRTNLNREPEGSVSTNPLYVPTYSLPHTPTKTTARLNEKSWVKGNKKRSCSSYDVIAAKNLESRERFPPAPNTPKGVKEIFYAGSLGILIIVS